MFCEHLLVIRWRLERFEEDEVQLRYQNALKAEVHGFSVSKLEGGMKGHDLVNEVLMEWENTVNRVAKSKVGDKTIVVERLDGGIMKLRSVRRELSKNIINGWENLMSIVDCVRR